MKVQKEARKLGIEELERREAPVLMDVPDGGDAPAPDPGTGDGGGSGGGTIPEVADQPGNSDGQRSKLYHENQ